MKFTKKDAYEHLVSKMLTNKGQTLYISERSVNEMLDTLMPLIANDETELESFVDSVLPMFKTTDLNVKNDVSVGITDIKKSYSPPTNKKEPEPKPTENDANNELLQRLSELEDKLKANEAKEKAVGLRQSFIAKSKEVGVKDDEWLSAYADILNISDGFDVDAQADSCLRFYNKSLSTIKKDATPKGGGGKSDDKHIQSVIASAAALAKASRGEDN
jgi:hypothetical protein